MRVRTPTIIESRRHAGARRGGHPRPSATPQPRGIAGPVDLAVYGCACGCDFTAAVSTSVACPHCGSLQDW